MKQHSIREAWLEDAVRHLEPVFSKAGYAIRQSGCPVAFQLPVALEQP